jgi:hypothetical protein
VEPAGGTTTLEYTQIQQRIQCTLAEPAFPLWPLIRMKVILPVAEREKRDAGSAD